MKTTKILLAILLVITACRTKEIFDKEINGIITGKQKLSETVQGIDHAFEAFEKEAPSDLVTRFINDQLTDGYLKYFSDPNSNEAIKKIFYVLLDKIMRENEAMFNSKNKTIIEMWRLTFKRYML